MVNRYKLRNNIDQYIPEIRNLVYKIHTDESENTKKFFTEYKLDEKDIEYIKSLNITNRIEIILYLIDNVFITANEKIKKEYRNFFNIVKKDWEIIKLFSDEKKGSIKITTIEENSFSDKIKNFFK